MIFCVWQQFVIQARKPMYEFGRCLALGEHTKRRPNGELFEGIKSSWNILAGIAKVLSGDEQVWKLGIGRKSEAPTRVCLGSVDAVVDVVGYMRDACGGDA